MKAACRSGHRYPENAYIRPDGRIGYCRACQAARCRDWSSRHPSMKRRALSDGVAYLNVLLAGDLDRDARSFYEVAYSTCPSAWNAWALFDITEVTRRGSSCSGSGYEDWPEDWNPAAALRAFTHDDNLRRERERAERRAIAIEVGASRHATPIFPAIWAFIDDDGTRESCWFWMGWKDDGGYGRYKQRAAHRLMYEEYVGPIAKGLTLDHLCFNKACVNPDHLEAVTSAENTRRGAVRRRELKATA